MIVIVVVVIVIVIVIICNGSMYISSSLALPYLDLSWVEWTSITIVIVGMTLYDLVLHYIIISYHIISHVLLFYLICWFDLDSILFHFILFYSILLYFKSIRFDLILFYWIRFTILFSIVSHINEWFVSICLSVRPSVYLSVCVLICMNKFMFSLLFLFSLPFFSFLMNVFLTHTWTRTRT